MSVVFALQTESVIIYVNEEFNTSFSIPEKLVWASACIGIAALVDFLDGFVARLLKASSELGKQLDSLSDVVSFGVAPGVILYQLLRLSFAKESNGLEISVICLVPAFILSCASAYRLAKFNIDSTQQYNFRGVPTPAIGLLVASFPLIQYYHTNLPGVTQLFLNKWFLYSVIVLLSFLMLCNLPVMGLKFKNYDIKSNLPKIILLIISIASALLLHWLAIPVIFICYLLISIVYKNKLA